MKIGDTIFVRDLRINEDDDDAEEKTAGIITKIEIDEKQGITSLHLNTGYIVSIFEGD